MKIIAKKAKFTVQIPVFEKPWLNINNVQNSSC